MSTAFQIKSEVEFLKFLKKGLTRRGMLMGGFRCQKTQDQCPDFYLGQTLFEIFTDGFELKVYDGVEPLYEANELAS